ncbi:MAG: ATP-binding protein [Fidelibacterota bacterium]
MKELVVISGKGGTGKTSVTGALAVIWPNAVFADCDVDASNLPILLNPEIREKLPFSGGKKAEIVEDDCTGCSLCESLCRFHAISQENNGIYQVDPLACEGCGLCFHACPVDAIRFEPVVNGELYVSDTAWGELIHAELYPGEENSGKLVTAVRQKARETAGAKGKSWILTDGAPGTGCPVIASLTGASGVLIVTEPGVSAIHDLERILELTKHFSIPAMILINKADISPEQKEHIRDIARREKVTVLGDIPYHPSFTKSQIKGQPVTLDGAPELYRIFEHIKQVILEKLA